MYVYLFGNELVFFCICIRIRCRFEKENKNKSRKKFFLDMDWSKFKINCFMVKFIFGSCIL